jgi:glycosyltransferase involved in cell wall biosynthesis
VFVRGTWWNDAFADEDMTLALELDVDFAPVMDLRPGIARRGRVRVEQRVARELFKRFRVVTPRVFGVGGPELLRGEQQIGADMTIVHSEAGLWVAQKLLSEGRRVGADFEDWFSQDLPESQRAGRPVDALQRIERDILRRAHYTATTTRALAEALAGDAGTDRVPLVVPNCFPAAERAAALAGPRDPRPSGAVSFHWFSQTIGPGRGLETLARALPLLRGEWHVSLRGSLRGYSDWFNRTFPDSAHSRVALLESVPNSELLARTMSHDVGLALEEPYCASRDLTATNKLFEYLRAGLAVIATRTRGQEEVMRATPAAGVLIRPADPADLANAMQALIDDRALLRSRQKCAVAAAETTWAWERHAGVVVAGVSAGLNTEIERPRRV